MPFTFSHPAIVIPLFRLSDKYISVTGLIIGSITPDFEYFLRLKIYSIHSHTLAGLFYFNLPLGLLLAFIFHLSVKRIIVHYLPYVIKSRVIIIAKRNWLNYLRKRWYIVCISILLGAFSHLVWDSFTHHSGYFVMLIPVLKKELILENYNIPYYKVLQHASTLLGIMYITYSIAKLEKINVVTEISKWRFWLGVLSMSIVMLVIYLGIEGSFALGTIIAATIAFLLLSITLMSLVTMCQKNTTTSS